MLLFILIIVIIIVLFCNARESEKVIEKIETNESVETTKKTTFDRFKERIQQVHENCKETFAENEYKSRYEMAINACIEVLNDLVNLKNNIHGCSNDVNIIRRKSNTILSSFKSLQLEYTEEDVEYALIEHNFNLLKQILSEMFELSKTFCSLENIQSRLNRRTTPSETITLPPYVSQSYAEQQYNRPYV